MNKDAILYGIIGLLAGSLITIVVASSAVNNNMTGMMRMMGMHQSREMLEESQDMMDARHDDGLSMQQMTDSLKGKTSDDFDKAFISLMIEHHQGAIDMANLAKVNAKHQEIKDLAVNITSAQTKEIEMMKNWQKTWGY